MIDKFILLDTWQNIGLKNNKIRMSLSHIEKDVDIEQ